MKELQTSGAACSAQPRNRAIVQGNLIAQRCPVLGALSGFQAFNLQRSTRNGFMGNASRTSQLRKFTPAQPRPDGACWLRRLSAWSNQGPWSESLSTTVPG